MSRLATLSKVVDVKVGCETYIETDKQHYKYTNTSTLVNQRLLLKSSSDCVLEENTALSNTLENAPWFFVAIYGQEKLHSHNVHHKSHHKSLIKVNFSLEILWLQGTEQASKEDYIHTTYTIKATLKA